MENLVIPVELTPVAIGQLEKIQTDIALIREKDSAVKFDYRDPKDNKAARSHVFSMRQINGTIDKAHASAKAGVLEIGKKLDAKKAELRAEVAALIDPHQKELDQIEQEEAERKARHQAVIQGIVAARTWTSVNDPREIEHALMGIRAVQVHGLDEFSKEAARQQLATVEHLTAALAGAVQREADAAELQKLREDAERAKIERLQREEAEAERRKAEQAERSMMIREAEERARAESAAAAERERLAREAQEKIYAAERRESEAKLAAERSAREKAEAEKRALEAEAQRKADAERAKEEAEIERKRAEWDAAEAAKKAAAERAVLQARIDDDLAMREQEVQAEMTREEEKKAAESANRGRVLVAISKAIEDLGAGGEDRWDHEDVTHWIAQGMIPHVRIDWQSP